MDEGKEVGRSFRENAKITSSCLRQTKSFRLQPGGKHWKPPTPIQLQGLQKEMGCMIWTGPQKNWGNVALLYIPKPQWTTDLCDILFLTTSSMEYIWKPNLPLYAAEDSVKWKLFPPAVKLIKSFCTVFCIFWNHCIIDKKSSSFLSPQKGRF